MSEPTVHTFQAEVNEVLRLVIHSLYSHPEVFLRELVSNASDALDRLRFRALGEPDLLPEGETPRIELIPNPDAGTLTIADNGIGMTAEELAKNLGTVAWSGSRDFVQQLRAAQESKEKGLQLIGQFGVGFYSSYLVADDVDVVSRAAGTTAAHRWSSQGKDTFTIEEAARERHGTSVVLHVRAEHREMLSEHRLRDLVERYSDYVEHPIELVIQRDGKEERRQLNRANALWQRRPAEVTAEQYEELYKHLARDWEGPLAWRHFHIEGTQMFAGVVFVPRRRGWDLFDPGQHHGMRLHVQRVFVLDEAEELVPRWLRFLRGVVDSEDLPLNVSRELLQDSRAVRTIRQQITSQTLDLLSEMSQEKPDDYGHFWNTFGVVLKEALHFEPDVKEKVIRLLRYESAGREGLTSLTDYVARMKEGQPAIYFAAGTSRAALEASPHLEALIQRGYEVLLMTDPVDPFAVSAIEDFEGKPLLSAMTAKLELPKRDGEGSSSEGDGDAAAHPLLERFRAVLGDAVAEVRPSHRLKDSPVCLVIPEGGMAPHVERMLRAVQRVDGPLGRRILEVNLDHALVQGLATVHERDGASPRVSAWIRALYDQAMLAEGSPVEDPARLARHLTELLQEVVRTEANRPA
ncbi:MAG: molecular chaperone HtpG [Polyangiaceae bacterium]|nr:molecular chaperone HtpG [Polyangiaceae bacterium]